MLDDRDFDDASIHTPLSFRSNISNFALSKMYFASMTFNQDPQLPIGQNHTYYLIYKYELLYGCIDEALKSFVLSAIFHIINLFHLTEKWNKCEYSCIIAK